MRKLISELESGWAIFGAIIVALAILFGLFCFESWIVMLLWNAIVVNVFVGVSELTFWWACGLNILVWLLFGFSQTVNKSKE